MTAPIADSVVGQVLALQIALAWAGEALWQPARLGRLKPDLWGPEAGGAV